MHSEQGKKGMARYRRDFWLDTGKDEELLLLETIDELKQQRRFTSVLRDGIRLVVDLRAGRLDVLFELFPWVLEKMQRGTSGGDGGELERRLDELQRLIMAQSNIPAPPPGYPMMKSGAPKALNVPNAQLPRFDSDDDGETVVLKKGSNSGAGMNFLNAAFSLQQ